MRRDVHEAEQVIHILRTLLKNALTLAARLALAVPQVMEYKEHKCPDSPGISGSERMQLSGWILQTRLVIC